MDYYEAWFDLKDSAEDMKLCEAVDTYMGYLQAKGLIEGWRLRRRKLGFAPDGWCEFNLTISCLDLQQLENAFQRAASRDSEVEPLHRDVYKRVVNAKFALYRDFPDAVRVR